MLHFLLNVDQFYYIFISDKEVKCLESTIPKLLVFNFFDQQNCIEIFLWYFSNESFCYLLICCTSNKNTYTTEKLFNKNSNKLSLFAEKWLIVMNAKNIFKIKARRQKKNKFAKIIIINLKQFTWRNTKSPHPHSVFI